MDFLEPIVFVVVVVMSIAAGITIGMGISYIKYAHFAKGVLNFDRSVKDEPPMMSVELKGVTPDMIAKSKFVLFRVTNKNYLSHD